MASALIRSILNAFSRSSSACTRARPIPAPASGWPSARRLSSAMGAESGSNPSRPGARRFTSLSPRLPPESVWDGLDTPLHTGLSNANLVHWVNGMVMKVLLRHAGMSLYYAGPKHWVGDADSALDLGEI